MVADDRAVDELLKASTAEHPPGHPPEGAAIVALHADAPEDAREDAQPPPDTAGGEAAKVHGVTEAVSERVRLLMRVSRIESVGVVRRLDAASPHAEDGIAGKKEVHVGFPPLLMAQPTSALQASPERRLRKRVEHVDCEDGDLRGMNELDDAVGRVVRVRVQSDDDSRDDLHPITVDRLHGLKDRQAQIL